MGGRARGRGGLAVALISVVPPRTALMLRKGDEPIPGYRLSHFMGRGAFGEVWRAGAPGGTSAALKFIDLNGKQGLKEYRAIQRVKEVRHAHLLPIYAFWMLDQYGDVLSDAELEAWDLSGSVMPTQTNPQVLHAELRPPATLVVAMLLGDRSVSERLDECRGPNGEPIGIPIDELIDYMEDAAKGIDFLNSPRHDLGDGPVALQHCDIKPQNLLLVGNSVLVCDFGLARVLGDDQRTKTAMAGSPAYMAPEVIRNRKPSNATDQYALAITYFELRTGRLPFDHESYAAVLDAHLRGKLDWSLLAPAEREVIVKATSLEPSARFATSLEMVRALRRAAGQDSSLANYGQVGSPRSGVTSSVVSQGAIATSASPLETKVSDSSGSGSTGGSHAGEPNPNSARDGALADLASSRETAMFNQAMVESATTDEEEDASTPSGTAPSTADSKSAELTPAKSSAKHVPKKPAADRPAKQTAAASTSSSKSPGISLVLWLAVASGLAFAAYKFWPGDDASPQPKPQQQANVVPPVDPSKNAKSDIPPNNTQVEVPNKNDKPPVDVTPVDPTKNQVKNPPVEPQPETLRLTFDPPDSQVMLNGVAAKLSESGEVELKHLPGENIAVTATHKGFTDFAATKTLAEWRDSGGKIELEVLPIDYVALGNELIEKGNVKQAIVVLEQAITAGFGCAKVYDALGTARQQIGDHVAAIDAFTKSIESDDSFAAAYRHRAASNLQSKRWTEAIADLDRLVEVSPDAAKEVVADRVAALTGRAYESLAAERFDDGLADCTAALEAAGENPQPKAIALVARGAVRRKQNDLTAAIDDFRDAAKFDADVAGRVKPALAEALLARGKNANEQAQKTNNAKLFDSAIEDLDESIKLAPTDEAFSSRGFSYNAKQHYDRAVVEFTRALNINPRNILALHNRGFAHNAKKEFAKGIEDLSQAILLKPNDHPTAYNNRGYAYLQLSEFDKAIDDYTEAIRQSREESAQSKAGLALAFRGRAERFEKQGDFDKAESDYSKALEQASAIPQLAEGLKSRINELISKRVTALVSSKKFKEAAVIAEQYVANHPKDGEAFATRGFVRFWQKEYKESLDDYTQAISLNSKNPRYYFQRGNVHLINGDPKLAVFDFTQAIGLNKEYAEAYEMRAKAHEQLGQSANAAADRKAAAAISAPAPAPPNSAPPTPNSAAPSK
jgi:tetratricopeptide (TPR) repeat protein/serine/threonine protein kinase